ncbi:MAG: hypothetical protein P0116_11615 [Candidatus Nitrosocosmicus sp.]|nr:hypothetical protein [Candidatus Nitrosocosmicus sp.]
MGSLFDKNFEAETTDLYYHIPYLSNAKLISLLILQKKLKSLLQIQKIPEQGRLLVIKVT